MTEQDAIPRIKAEIEAKKAEEVTINSKYKRNSYNGTDTFALLPEIQLVQKRRVELEDALRILEEFRDAK